MVPFGHIVHAHCRSPTDIIRPAGRILSVIGSHIVVDFHLFVIIGIGIGIVHLHRNPFRIQLLVGVRFIPADGFLGLRGMGEFAHPIAGTQHHVFRFAVHPGIADLGVLLDGNDFIAFSHNQISLRIIGGISIASLGGGICLVFDVHRLVGQGIVCIGGSCLSPIRDSKERCRQDKGCQDGGFTTASAAAAAYMAIVMALGQFRHDNVTISCFTPNNFKDFIHSTSPLSEYIS